MSTAVSPSVVRDPYELKPSDIVDPPSQFLAILKRIGPGMILSASIVGSGELIATTTLGAEVGYLALWVIIFSCLIKPAVQSELGRYIIASGETGFEGFNHVPGLRIAGVNWIVWAWAVMVFVTFAQIGAMFGGVAQVLSLLWPAIPVTVWVIGLLILSLFLLLGGGYDRVEKIATVKVGLFTMLTFLCAMLMTRQPQYFTWDQIREGFQLKLPGAGLATAIAVFGITGVGASELIMYPYWCVEKGYARFTGRRDGTPAWRQRALGWIRVMNVDILASMFIYTVATLAFYMLGAGILHNQGLVPSAKDMIPTLSRMYTDTLGKWALPLFYLGAIATLYGTIFAATAGNSRVLADIVRLTGSYERNDYASRVRWRRIFIWIHLVVPAGLFLFFQSPVLMVKAGGIAQALMLPLIAAGALYLRHQRCPKEIEPSILNTLGLWIASILMIGLMLYYAYLLR